jgi:hypothetical protein
MLGGNILTMVYGWFVFCFAFGLMLACSREVSLRQGTRSTRDDSNS